MIAASLGRCTVTLPVNRTDVIGGWKSSVGAPPGEGKACCAYKYEVRSYGNRRCC
jgi:hypothetical protein